MAILGPFMGKTYLTNRFKSFLDFSASDWYNNELFDYILKVLAVRHYPSA